MFPEKRQQASGAAKNWMKCRDSMAGEKLGEAVAALVVHSCRACGKYTAWRRAL
jgi:hypothetical protein